MASGREEVEAGRSGLDLFGKRIDVSAVLQYTVYAKKFRMPWQKNVRELMSSLSCSLFSVVVFQHF